MGSTKILDSMIQNGNIRLIDYLSDRNTYIDDG
jgi:hypothetical protein